MWVNFTSIMCDCVGVLCVFLFLFQLLLLFFNPCAVCPKCLLTHHRYLSRYTVKITLTIFYTKHIDYSELSLHFVELTSLMAQPHKLQRESVKSSWEHPGGKHIFEKQLLNAEQKLDNPQESVFQSGGKPWRYTTHNDFYVR